MSVVQSEAVIGFAGVDDDEQGAEREVERGRERGREVEREVERSRERGREDGAGVEVERFDRPQSPPKAFAAVLTLSALLPVILSVPGPTLLANTVLVVFELTSMCVLPASWKSQPWTIVLPASATMAGVPRFNAAVVFLVSE